MAQILVGPATDLETYLRTEHTVWFDEVSDAPSEAKVLSLPEHLRFAATIEDADPATYPGIYGVRPMTLSVPGVGDEVRRMPVAGLTWVGVHPDHRRRGVLNAMMCHHLEQVRDEPGTHLSVLHASEPAIYGRYGYGLASHEVMVTLGRGTTLTAPHLDADAAALETRLATITDPGMPQRLTDAWVRSAATSPGTIVGEAEFYEGMCAERPEDVRGKESFRVLFACRDGVDVGLALFQRDHKWERGRPGGELTVHHLAGDAAARLALLRRLVDFDLIGTVKVYGLGVDDPLLLWLAGPRGAADVATYDSLWVRLVDLPAALEARGYAAACDLVLDVTDATLPAQGGRWRLLVDDAGAARVERVERVDTEADLRLPVAALGACYLGGVSPVALVRAGLVEELRPGAAHELGHSVRAIVAPNASVGF
ncbi:MAG: GNAT family N-acetyltransferase [Nocardioides sp.]